MPLNKLDKETGEEIKCSTSIFDECSAIQDPTTRDAATSPLYLKKPKVINLRRRKKAKQNKTELITPVQNSIDKI